MSFHINPELNMTKTQEFIKNELLRHFERLMDDSIPQTGFVFKKKIEDADGEIAYHFVQKFCAWTRLGSPRVPISSSAQMKVVPIYKCGLWFILSDDPSVPLQSIIDTIEKENSVEKRSLDDACEFLPKELMRQIGNGHLPSGIFLVGQPWKDAKHGFDSMDAIRRAIGIHQLSKNAKITIRRAPDDLGDYRQIIIDDR